MPYIMAGDPVQLLPPCMSTNMRYKSADGSLPGCRVNLLSEQFHLSPQKRLRDIGWPYWVIPEQCRIEPGGFATSLSKSVSVDKDPINHSFSPHKPDELRLA